MQQTIWAKINQVNCSYGNQVISFSHKNKTGVVKLYIQYPYWNIEVISHLNFRWRWM